MKISVDKTCGEFDITLHSVEPSELNDKLNEIAKLAYNHTGHTPPDPFDNINRVGLTTFVINMAGHLEKIPMIKAIRALTNAGLKESKDFVDDIQRMQNLQFGTYKTTWPS